MLDQLQPLLSGLDDVMDSVNSFRSEPAGRLRLMVPPPVAHFLIAPLLAKFSARYPEIELEVVVQTGLEDIVAGRFDAGVLSQRFLAQDMVAIRLTPRLQRAVVAAPSYIAKMGRPENPGELRLHNCIRIRLPSGDLMPWVFVIGGKETEVHVKGSLVLNNPELDILSALEGLGIAYTRREFVAPLIAGGRLLCLFDDALLPKDDGFYLFHTDRKLTPAPLRAFISFLQDTGYAQER